MTPSDVIVHGRGGVEEVLRVLQHIVDASTRAADASMRAPGASRQFNSLNEFEAPVARVQSNDPKVKATVKLRKLFLCGKSSCSVMQEIRIEDKNNPDAPANPLKSYAVVHVHHHTTTAVSRKEEISE